MGERGEALMRIVVFVISGIILGVWRMLIKLFAVLNFLWTLISGKRIEDLAELSEIWNTQKYIYYKYMTFVTNERPFPFSSLHKSISKFKRK